MADFSLTLTENAEDFLLEAAKYARESSPRAWKYAILHLCSAAELLLKALLEEKGHWSLLFEDVNKASSQMLSKGDFRSVDFDAALDRAQHILGIKITTRDLRYLKQLRRLRNRANHFAVRLNVEQAKSLVARGISLFHNLQQQHLHEEPDKDLEYGINQTLHEFEKYVRERLRALRPALEVADRPPGWLRTCRACDQDAVVCEDEDAACLFCGARMEFVHLAGYSDGEGGPCPECQVGALAFQLYNNDEGRFVCVKCGFEAERSLSSECSKCGREFWDDDDRSMCDDCWSHLAEKE